MSKLYFYTDISKEINDNEDVVIRVELLSTSATGFTNIQMPDGSQKGIPNSGSVILGVAKELKEKQILINSRPFVIADKIDVELIKVKLFVNNEEKVFHENEIEIEPTPSIFIILTIK